MSKDTAFNGETPLRHPSFVTTCNVCPLEIPNSPFAGKSVISYVLIYNPEVLSIIILIFSGTTQLLCSSRKYPYPSLSATEGNGNSEGRGVQKEAISKGVGGFLQRVFSTRSG